MSSYYDTRISGKLQAQIKKLSQRVTKGFKKPDRKWIGETYNIKFGYERVFLPGRSEELIHTDAVHNGNGKGIWERANWECSSIVIF